MWTTYNLQHIDHYLFADQFSGFSNIKKGFDISPIYIFSVNIAKAYDELSKFICGSKSILLKKGGDILQECMQSILSMCNRDARMLSSPS